ncbi:hypothetical protein Tco_0597410 [Tanacetum coccineum]
MGLTLHHHLLLHAASGDSGASGTTGPIDLAQAPHPPPRPIHLLGRSVNKTRNPWFLKTLLASANYSAWDNDEHRSALSNLVRHEGRAGHIIPMSAWCNGADLLLMKRSASMTSLAMVNARLLEEERKDVADAGLHVRTYPETDKT